MASPSDSAWLSDAVDRHEAALVRYARRLTGDLERARDVVQDVFVRLCGQERSAVEDHLAEWLFTVCRNRALDVCRKEGRMTTIDDDGRLASLRSPEPAPGTALERRERLGHVLALLDTLPSRQQEVIRLKFQSGLSYKEISRITSHSVSYVGVLIHTGMKTLRARLGALSPEA